MKPKLTFFYTNECGKCADLKPIINEFAQHLNIQQVNTYEDDLLTESNGVQWVPTLVIEDQNGKHKFEGPQEIKKVLYEIVSPSKTN
jgi:thiol-disulfide isomerase/thioredoxin